MWASYLGSILHDWSLGSVDDPTTHIHRALLTASRGSRYDARVKGGGDGGEDALDERVSADVDVPATAGGIGIVSRRRSTRTIRKQSGQYFSFPGIGSKGTSVARPHRSHVVGYIVFKRCDSSCCTRCSKFEIVCCGRGSTTV